MKILFHLIAGAALWAVSSMPVAAQTNAPSPATNAAVLTTNAPAATKASRKSVSKPAQARNPVLSSTPDPSSKIETLKDTIRSEHTDPADEVRKKIDAFRETREEFLATQKEVVRANREGLNETQRQILFDTIKGNQDEFRVRLNDFRAETLGSKHDLIENLKPSVNDLRSTVKP